jgi:hypothetical protein
MTDRSGVCVCGVLVADHFSKRNIKLSCEDVQKMRPSTAPSKVDQVRPGLRLVKSERQSVARIIDAILWDQANDKRQDRR